MQKKTNETLGTKDVEPRREKKKKLATSWIQKIFSKGVSNTTAIFSSVKKNANAIAPLAKRKKCLSLLTHNVHQ